MAYILKTTNFKHILILVLAALCHRCLVSGRSQDNSWSMVMEVEVEDPEPLANNSIPVSSGSSEASKQSPAGLLRQQHPIRCGARQCFNGARCYRSAKAPFEEACLCQIGFSGQFCENVNHGYQFPRIREGGYLKFLYPQQVRNRDYKSSPASQSLFQDFTISFQFQPIKTDGHHLLVYHYSPFSTGPQFILSIEGQKIVYRLALNSAVSTKKQLDKAEIRHNMPVQPDRTHWYHVQFGYLSPGTMFISVNEQRQELNILQPKKSPLRYIEQQIGFHEFIYFGGHPELGNLPKQNPLFENSVKENFVGCIQNIRIGDRSLDPRRKSFVGDAVDGFGIDDCAQDLCLKNPCLNNGTCRPTSGSTYECQCPLGFTGALCNTQVTIYLPSYTGNSFTVYKGLQGTSRSQTTIQITFMPRSMDGLLLYEGFSIDKRGDFLAMLISNGYFVVLYDLGSGMAELRSPKKLTLQVWHTAEFWRIGREGFLQLDFEQRIQTAFSIGNLVQLTLSQHLYLGGHPDLDMTSANVDFDLLHTRSYNLTGFQGCISEISINGVSLRLMEQLIKGVNVANCREHACSNPASACSNRGECVSRQGDFQCSCLLGYTGTFCQEKIVMEKLERISLAGNGFLEFTSQSILTMLNTPHFDIYMDVRRQPLAVRKTVHPLNSVGDSRSSFLIVGVEEKHFEIRLLTMSVTARGFPSLSLLRYDTRSGQTTTYSNAKNVTVQSRSGTLLYPNHWHKIMLKRRMNDFLLFVNGTPVGSFNPEQFGIADLTFSKWFIGGLNMDLPLAQDSLIVPVGLSLPQSPMNQKSSGFRGCIGHIHINGRPIRPGDAQTGRNIDACDN